MGEAHACHGTFRNEFQKWENKAAGYHRRSSKSDRGATHSGRNGPLLVFRFTAKHGQAIRLRIKFW
jgi:hypothetical protein